MKIAIGIYLAVFAAGGAWSVIPKVPTTPLHERVVEGIAFGALSLGVLWFLLERPVPGGSILWLVITGVVCIAELLVIVKDRRREYRAEVVRSGSAEGVQTLFQITDTFVALFFLPAIVINVKQALG